MLDFKLPSSIIFRLFADLSVADCRAQEPSGSPAASRSELTCDQRSPRFYAADLADCASPFAENFSDRVEAPARRSDRRLRCVYGSAALQAFGRAHRDDLHLGAPLARPMAQPPDAALLDRPRIAEARRLARHQVGGHQAQRRLMADDQHRLARIRPARGGQQALDVAVRRRAPASSSRAGPAPPPSAGSAAPGWSAPAPSRAGTG